MGRKRRSPLRRLLPWLLVALLGASVAFFVRTATEDNSIVETAIAVRLGDRAREIEPDPYGAIELLEGLLERDPDHFGAHEEIARAYQQIQAFDKAIEHLELALAAAPGQPQTLRVLRALVSAHTAVGHYDEAVDYGERVVALQPDNIVRKLQLGDTHYRGSVEAQTWVVNRLLGNYRTQRGAELEAVVEDFVTERRVDLTSDDVSALLVTDSRLRVEATDMLQAAKDRFALARQTIGPLYYAHEGFDGSIATSYVSLLVRSGRYYEAMLEIHTALREPSMQASGARRTLLEQLALCSESVGDHATAADAYEEMLESMLAERLPRIPTVLVASLYEARIRAGQWDWILARAEQDLLRFFKDVYIQYAQAAALAAQGEHAEAFEAVLEPYTTIALGRELTMPSSVRMHPRRRKEVVLLALDLFERTKDRRVNDALQYLVTQFPDDAALRLKLVQSEVAARNLESAAIEAQRLLTSTGRDRADFDRWLAISDDLSQQRFGASLAARALERLEGAKRFRQQISAMREERDRVVGDRRAAADTLPQTTLNISAPEEPALWFTLVEGLLADGDTVEARLQLRKLASEFPGINEFRFRLGRLLVRDGLLEAALEEFLVLLDTLPDDSEVLDLAMRTMRALGREEEAARLVSELVLADPLGLGAVRYGHELLDKGRPAEAQRLVERLVRWTDVRSLDISMLSARAYLAMGDMEAAEAILTALINQHPDSIDVITLALHVGIEGGKGGLRATALEAVDSVAAELFPEQMVEIAELLLAAGAHEKLLGVIDARVRALPVARGALRSLAEASKALGRFGETYDLLLEMDGDPYAPLDRFLLLSLQGQTSDAAHRVRLERSRTSIGDITGVCLAIADAFDGRDVLLDGGPDGRVVELCTPLGADTVATELLDATLRVMPALDRLASVVPPEAVDAPTSLYGSAGRDVERLVALSRDNPSEARVAWRMLAHMLLMGDRSFWDRERTFLAEGLRARVPGLAFPTRMLARDRLRSGDAEGALSLLFPLISDDEPDPEALRMFTVAARLMGHPEWGVAVTTELREVSDDALLLLADLMRGESLHAVAGGLYEELLGRAPDHPRALDGLVQVARSRRDDAAVLDWVRRAIAAHPEDAELMRTCANAIAVVREPDEDVVFLLDTLFDRDPDNMLLGDALARAQRGDPPAMRATLDTMVARARATPLSAGDEEQDRERVANLTRAARTARDAGFFDIAQQLSDLALLIDPAGIDQFRELAYIAQQRGDLRAMRRYLEAVNVLDPNDRESAMTLARLLFEDFGEPVEGAAVVRRSFPTGATPPEALGILAGELFLKGRPDAAIQIFYRIQDAPTIPDKVFHDIGLIAYASGEDELARQLFDHLLDEGRSQHPRLPRIRYLRDNRVNDKVLRKRAQEAVAADGVGSNTPTAPAAAAPEGTLQANAKTGSSP